MQPIASLDIKKWRPILLFFFIKGVEVRCNHGLGGEGGSEICVRRKDSVPWWLWMSVLMAVESGDGGKNLNICQRITLVGIMWVASGGIGRVYHDSINFVYYEFC